MNDTLIGTTIGGYHILEEVGRGGMATVYRARQISMDRDVAIKVLPPQFVHQATSLERFKQEASIVARLEHRAIVPVHDYGEYEGVPYLVMRYMDAGSVDELLAEGPILPERTLQIVQQIAPALDYAHREGVLHRDLKPSNILLDANGDAFITDFGIARFLGGEAKPLTTSGVVGTPSYMSPEQAQGYELDGRSDVYALGVVLFEMLTGARPFEGETPYSVAVKHVTEAPPSASEINSTLPRAVDPVLFKALAKNRESRYQTAGELAAGLKEALETPSGSIPDRVDLKSIVPETEPSLNEALRAGAARRGLDTSQPIIPRMPPPIHSADDLRQSPPGIQVLPAYVPPPHSHTYTGPIVPPQRRPKSSGWPSWVTWAVLAFVIGGVLLATVLGGLYYVLNWDNPSGPTLSENYNSTAVFKLTATREAIQQTLDHPTIKTATASPETTSTIPPTNTLKAPQTTSVSLLSTRQ